jgi:hypothetical protein
MGKKISTRKERFYYYIDDAISPNLNGLQRFGVLIDLYWEKIFYGVNLSNYFQFGFYWRKSRDRRTFINGRRMSLIYDVCNAKSLRDITRDKARFNERFSTYLGRVWADFSVLSYEEFLALVKDLPRFFIKENSGERGQGVMAVDSSAGINFREIYETARANNAVLEEEIKQHAAMASLNESSVNTIRVFTLRDASEEIHIMGATVRIGRAGEVVDNFHHRGICALIDCDTGIVSTTGVDYYFHRYVVHPDSGVPIVGFIIPDWEKILKVAKRAAEEMTELRYIGWDIAVGRDGQPMIIEANSMPDTVLLQFPSQKGYWPNYKPLIDQLRRAGLSSEGK